MRIAILNRRRDTHPGGDLTQIDATIEALGRYGVVAEYAPEGWDTSWLRGFDLAHIFHCNFGWSVYNYEMVMKGGVPYVVTPIFYPTTELGADARKIREMLYNARCVFPNSSREQYEILEVLGITPKMTEDYPPFIPIPNGTDTLFWGPFDTHDERSGVICVTPRPGDKNTDLVERVCDRLQLPFRVVSGVEDRHELAKIYWGARVFVNASTSERMSLTTGEALVAGCRVIDTRENRGNEWYGSHLVRFDPLNEAAAQTLMIFTAYHSHSTAWNYAPNRAAQRITWPWVAKELTHRYEKALERG